ncbi:hypothetical protein KIW84_062889, partial [Lathyrus oleraceus]
SKPCFLNLTTTFSFYINTLQQDPQNNTGFFSIPNSNTFHQIMDMKKVTCAVLIAAASMSAALAATVDNPAPAPAPGPASAASTTVVGSLVGASLLSFIALFH